MAIKIGLILTLIWWTEYWLYFILGIAAVHIATVLSETPAVPRLLQYLYILDPINILFGIPIIRRDRQLDIVLYKSLSDGVIVHILMILNTFILIIFTLFYIVQDEIIDTYGCAVGFSLYLPTIFRILETYKPYVCPTGFLSHVPGVFYPGELLPVCTREDIDCTQTIERTSLPSLLTHHGMLQIEAVIFTLYLIICIRNVQ